MAEMLELVERAKWGGAHWLMFASTSIGYFIWGLVTTLGFLAYPQFHSVYYLVAVTLIPIVGDVLIARVSDLSLGRKGTFFLTMTLIGVGVALIAVDLLYVKAYLEKAALMLLGYAMADVGVEGEVPVALTLLAELTPAAYREEVLVLSTNFDNIGATVAAAIAALTYSLTDSLLLESIAVLTAAGVALAAAIIVRGLMPESIRWLTAKGRKDEAVKELKRLSATPSDVRVRDVDRLIGLWPKFTMLAVLGVSQYITYGLMAYVVGAYYFSSSTLTYNYVIMYANLGASVAGLLAAWLVRRLDIRSFAVLAYGGGYLSMVPIMLWLALAPNNMALFYVLLFVNMAFSEFAWAVRTVLEPTLFPTNIRATMIGLVRVAPIALYSALTYITSSFSLWQFLLLNLFMWFIGYAPAAWWSGHGYDLRLTRLESASGELHLRPGRPSGQPGPA